MQRPPRQTTSAPIVAPGNGVNEPQVVDDKSKVVYLIQYCKGRARKSIENYVLLEPESGYKRGREIWAAQFWSTPSRDP